MRSRIFIHIPRPRAQHTLAIRNKLKCGHFVRDSGRIDVMCRPNINIYTFSVQIVTQVFRFTTSVWFVMHLLCAGFDGRRDVRGDLDSTQFWYYTFSIFGSIFRNLPHHRILDSALCVFKFRCYKFAQSTFFGILKEICCCVFLHLICSSRNRTHHIEIYCSALCSNPKKYIEKKYQTFFNAINSAESHERVVNLLLVFACLFGIPQNIYMWIRHVAPNRLFSLA